MKNQSKSEVRGKTNPAVLNPNRKDFLSSVNSLRQKRKNLKQNSFLEKPSHHPIFQNGEKNERCKSQEQKKQNTIGRFDLARKSHIQKLMNGLKIVGREDADLAEEKTEQKERSVMVTATCYSFKNFNDKESQVKNFEDWQEIKGKHILRDREPLTLEVKRHSYAKFIIDSRFKSLPLSFNLEKEKGAYAEVFIDFNRYPTRSSYAKYSVENKVQIGVNHSEDLLYDFSIRVVVYFYSFDVIRFFPVFSSHFVQRALDNVKGIVNLSDYDQYYGIKLHRPSPQRRKNRAQTSPRFNSKIDSPPKSSFNGFQRKKSSESVCDKEVHQVGDLVKRHDGQKSDQFSFVEGENAQPEKDGISTINFQKDRRVPQFDTTNSTFNSVLFQKKAPTDQFINTENIFGSRESKEPNENFKNKTWNSFFFKKQIKENIYKERVLLLNQKIQDAKQKKQDIHEARNHSMRKCMISKKSRAERENAKFLNLLQKLVQTASSRFWVQVIFLQRWAETTKILLEKNQKKRKLTNELYSTIVFDIKLKKSIRSSKILQPYLSLGQVKCALRLFSNFGLSQSFYCGRARNKLGNFLEKAWNTFHLRAQFQTTFIRLIEIKMRFMQNMARKKSMKANFITELNKYNSHLLERSSELPFSYKDFVWIYQDDLFEMVYNSRVNEKLARDVIKINAARIKHRLIKRPNPDHMKFKLIFENMEKGIFYEKVRKANSEFKLLELINQNFEKKMDHFKKIVHNFIETNGTNSPFSRTVRKIRTINRLIHSPDVIFDNMAVLDHKKLNMSFSAAQFICMLFSIYEYHLKKSRSMLIKKSSTFYE